MPKKTLPPEMAIEDAYTRLANLYHFPFGTPEVEIKQIIQALFEARNEEEYFNHIKELVV